MSIHMNITERKKKHFSLNLFNIYIVNILKKTFFFQKLSKPCSAISISLRPY